MFKKIKKYGLGETRLGLFKKQFGLNQRTNDIYFKEKLKYRFEKLNKNLLTNRKLFENIKANVTFLKTLKSFKGFRHRNHYPVRGQRTHTNATKKLFKRKKILSW